METEKMDVAREKSAAPLSTTIVLKVQTDTDTVVIPRKTYDALLRADANLNLLYAMYFTQGIESFEYDAFFRALTGLERDKEEFNPNDREIKPC